MRHSFVHRDYSGNWITVSSPLPRVLYACLEPRRQGFQSLDEEELVLKKVVTLGQEVSTPVQQGGFLFPKLLAFLQKPLDWKRARIVLVAIAHEMFPRFNSFKRLSRTD